MTATLRFEDKIAVLDLGEDENRFSPEWLDSVDKLLDQALSESAHALVTTATGKFYSNGLDLDWLGANGDKAKWYVQQVQSLFARMLTFPMPTVAAINGHAIGLGLDIGVLCDIRLAGASAKMASSFVKVGIIPGDGGAWLLPRLVGMARATALTFQSCSRRSAMSHSRRSASSAR